MTGSVQHLGGDRYRVRVYAGPDPITGKGRTRSRSYRAANMRAAQKASTKHIEALEQLIREGAEKRGTVAELAEEWTALKQRQGRSPTTLDGYRAITRRIVERFGRLPVDAVDGRQLDRWYGELLAEGMTPNTVGHHHAVMRAMLRQAEKWGQVDHVATRRASPPPAEKVELNIPTDDVVRVVLASATGDFAHALRILAGTGMRRGELVGLAFGDLDGHWLTIRRAVVESESGLKVKSTKGRRARSFDVGDEVVEAFTAMRATAEERAKLIDAKVTNATPVFGRPHEPSEVRPPSWVSHRWEVLRSRCGVGFRVHDVRHWHATMLLRAGVPLADVSYRLGHAQTSTTLNIYAHATRVPDGLAVQATRRALNP